MVSMVASCSMLRAPGNPLPGAGHGLAAASNEGRISAGAVVSAQAVVTTQATMAVAMRSLRRIIGASVQLRFVTGDAFALGTRSRLTGLTQPSMIGRPPQQNIR